MGGFNFRINGVSSIGNRFGFPKKEGRFSDKKQQKDENENGKFEDILNEKKKDDKESGR